MQAKWDVCLSIVARWLKNYENDVLNFDIHGALRTFGEILVGLKCVPTVSCKTLLTRLSVHAP